MSPHPVKVRLMSFLGSLWRNHLSQRQALVFLSFWPCSSGTGRPPTMAFTSCSLIVPRGFSAFLLCGLTPIQEKKSLSAEALLATWEEKCPHWLNYFYSGTSWDLKHWVDVNPFFHGRTERGEGGMLPVVTTSVRILASVEQSLWAHIYFVSPPHTKHGALHTR